MFVCLFDRSLVRVFVISFRLGGFVLCVNLSVCLFVGYSVCPCGCWVSVFGVFVCLSLWLVVCLIVGVVCFSVCRFIGVFACRFIWFLNFGLRACLSGFRLLVYAYVGWVVVVCLFVWVVSLLCCLFIRLSVCLFVYLFVCWLMCLLMCLFVVWFYWWRGWLSVCLCCLLVCFTCLFVC